MTLARNTMRESNYSTMYYTIVRKQAIIETATISRRQIANIILLRNGLLVLF